MKTARQLRRAEERRLRKQNRKGDAAVAPAPSPSAGGRPQSPALAPRATGPRTPEGKATSSQNAFAHGLTSAKLVLPWENAAEFEELLHGLITEHQPATVTEGVMVREMAEQYWRLQRARNREHFLLSQTEDVLERSETDGVVFVAWQKDVTLTQRYATRHERAFHKCLNTLRRLQKERRAKEAEGEEDSAAEFVSQDTADELPELAKPAFAAGSPDHLRPLFHEEPTFGRVSSPFEMLGGGEN